MSTNNHQFWRSLGSALRGIVPGLAAGAVIVLIQEGAPLLIVLSMLGIVIAFATAVEYGIRSWDLPDE